MTSSVHTAVCDAGPLIHLSELGCLDLLLDFERVLVPEVVAPKLLASIIGEVEQL